MKGTQGRKRICSVKCSWGGAYMNSVLSWTGEQRGNNVISRARGSKHLTGLPSLSPSAYTLCQYQDCWQPLGFSWNTTAQAQAGGRTRIQFASS